MIGIASDHAAFPLKQFVIEYLKEKGLEFKDYGTYSPDSCNYADYGHALARGIENGEVDAGFPRLPTLSVSTTMPTSW